MPPLQEYRSATPAVGPEKQKFLQMLAQYRDGGAIGGQSPFPTATRDPQMRRRSPWNERMALDRNMGARRPQPMIGPEVQQPARQDNDLIRRLMALRQGPMMAQPTQPRQLR